MTMQRPHRFPPLSQLAARQVPSSDLAPEHSSYQAAVSDGFQQGLDKGYQEGFASGMADGLRQGETQGFEQGRSAGHAQAQQEVMARFEHLAQPIDAMLEQLKQLQADYHSALRKEVVELVAKVARQVIRCELALQPTQLLAMVDETLSAMPPTQDQVEVYLHPEERQRLLELAPERTSAWCLIADASLDLGECRVKAGDREADAGCLQRLNACMDQVRSQLLDDVSDENAPSEHIAATPNQDANA